MGPSVIFDDIDPFLLLSNGSWTRKAGADSTFNNTLTVYNPQLQNTAGSPWLNTSFFYGSDINIYGTLTNTVSMRYSFDNGSMTTATVSPNATNSAAGKSGVNLLSLQGSAEKISHILELFPTSGLLSIDYITVKPSKYTNITGHNLIIDDTDEAIQYAGTWNQTTRDFPLFGSPYNGTISGSNTTGSTMNFTYAGGSISVYGLLHPQAGKLSASFSVDGGASTNFTPYDGSQTANASSWLLFQQFFHQDLAPGNHSLLVTLEQATGSQMLWIDSIIYQGALVAEAVNSPNTTGSGNTTNTNNPTKPHKLKISGSAIGGIVAFIVIAVAIVALIWWIRQRRRKLAARRWISSPIDENVPYDSLPMYGVSPPHSGPTLTRQVDADPPPFTPARSRASQEYRPHPAQDPDPDPNDAEDPPPYDEGLNVR